MVSNNNDVACVCVCVCVWLLTEIKGSEETLIRKWSLAWAGANQGKCWRKRVSDTEHSEGKAGGEKLINMVNKLQEAPFLSWKVLTHPCQFLVILTLYIHKYLTLNIYKYNLNVYLHLILTLSLIIIYHWPFSYSQTWCLGKWGDLAMPWCWGVWKHWANLQIYTHLYSEAKKIDGYL